MKKKQHSIQSRFSFKINGNSSSRSLRSSVRSVNREISDKLVTPVKNSASESVIDTSELKLADEISSSELKQFSFSCIESLATLTAAQKPYILDALMGVVAAKLPSYGGLVSELQVTKAELVEQKQSIKKQENKTKVLDVVIDTMCKKHCVENLSKRIHFLQTILPAHVAQTGVQLGFPEEIMNKVVKVIGVALKKSA